MQGTIRVKVKQPSLVFSETLAVCGSVPVQLQIPTKLTVELLLCAWIRAGHKTTISRGNSVELRGWFAVG